MAENLTDDHFQTIPTADLAKPTTTNENKGEPRRSPLTTEQQRLAMRYLPMAKSLAKPLKLNWPSEWEEFDSAALLALVEAAQSYDPTRNVKFGTFARYRIWGALRDVQRGLIAAGWRHDMENAPTLTRLDRASEEHGVVLGAKPDAPVGEEYEALDFVENWLRKLPTKHAEACRQIYVHDRSQGEAADCLGCSKSRVSYLHREAIDLLKEIWHLKSRIKDGRRARSRKRSPRPGPR